MKYRLVATAGHVDHGKTALLRQLTGQQTDRLDEEQQRGLTIDLGFADLKTDDLQIGFVDVPGHQNFIKNMVTGVGLVQGILFVVSARDGWQAQSREHFEIIRLLEPDFCCFAMTKIDLVDDEMQLLVRSEIEDAVAGTQFEHAEIFPVSSKTGEGVEDLSDFLVHEIAETPEPEDEGKPYFPVDRVFTVKGQGTVMTGSLSWGSMEEGIQVTRMPGGEPGNVRGLQQYHEDVQRANPGARTALNVGQWDRDDVKRGDIVTVPSAGTVGSFLDGAIRTSRNLENPLEHNKQVLAYIGTDRVKARILTMDQRSVPPDSKEFVRLKLLDDSVFSRPGDRIIVRDFNDRVFIGCLEVGNVDPYRSLGEEEYREWLEQRFPVSPKSIVRTHLMNSNLATVEEIARGTRYSCDSIRQSASGIPEVRDMSGEVLVDEEWWNESLDRLTKKIDDFHEDNPVQPGLPIGNVPERLRKHFDLVEESFTDRGYTKDGDILRAEDFSPQLTGDQEKQLQSMLEELNEMGIETPPRSELESRYSDEIVRYSVVTEKAISLNDDRLLSADVLSDTKQSLKQWMGDGEPRTLSDIRDFLESSRKYVIPLMEYLDRVGVTFRDGDHRYLRESGETDTS
ncbi:MAG: selenocysteine-specific translation elongation factor [bacterium]